MEHSAARVPLLLLISFFLFSPEAWGDPPSKILAQEVYLPLYSSIFVGDRDMVFNMSENISIRNVDRETAIVLETVDYFDTQGRLLRSLIDSPRSIPPFSSTHFHIRESEDAGSTGAKLLVRWRAEKGVNPPLVEAIMVSTRSQQGISFTTRGIVLSETVE